jgi:Uncharacterized conserved protein, contains RING Zn-finger
MRVSPESIEIDMNRVNGIFDSDPDLMITHETQFKKVFKSATKEFLGFNYVSFVTFLILLIFTQLTHDNLAYAMNIFRIFIGIHAIFLMKNYLRLNKSENKRSVGFQIFKEVSYLVLLLTIEGENPHDTKFSVIFNIFSSLVLFNFFVSTLVYYVSNRSLKHKVFRYANKRIFFMRLVMVIQFILILVQVKFKIDISWLVLFIPFWIIIIYQILLLLCLIFRLHSKHGRYLLEHLRTNSEQNVIVIVFTIWFLLNCLLAWGLLFIAFDLDGGRYVTFNVNYIPVLASIIGFNLLSLMYIHSSQKTILAAAKSVGAFCELTQEEKDRIQNNYNKEKEKRQEKEKKKEIEQKKYVLKMSNTYFKVITSKERKEINKALGRCCMDCFPVKSKNIQNATQNDKTRIEELKQDEEYKDPLCVICYERQPDAVYLDCGHGGVCHTCAVELIKSKNECHLCRTKIERLLKIQLKDQNSQIYKIISSEEVTTISAPPPRNRS